MATAIWHNWKINAPVKRSLPIVLWAWWWSCSAKPIPAHPCRTRRPHSRAHRRTGCRPGPGRLGTADEASDDPTVLLDITVAARLLDITVAARLLGVSRTKLYSGPIKS